MSNPGWKQFERRVARFFGAGRTPLSGGNSGHTRSDSLHPDLFIECKQRKSSATVKLFRETETLAKKENKTPVVALQQTNDTKGWLLVCRPKDLFLLASHAKDYDNLPTDKCRWTYNEDMEAWETDCGNAFCLENDDPADNHMDFCPYCGRPLDNEPQKEAQ